MVTLIAKTATAAFRSVGTGAGMIALSFLHEVLGLIENGVLGLIAPSAFRQDVAFIRDINRKKLEASSKILDAEVTIRTAKAVKVVQAVEAEQAAVRAAAQTANMPLTIFGPELLELSLLPEPPKTKQRKARSPKPKPVETRARTEQAPLRELEVEAAVEELRLALEALQQCGGEVRIGSKALHLLLEKLASSEPEAHVRPGEQDR
jgi:hypothetical protein